MPSSFADPVQPPILPKSLLRLYDPLMVGCDLPALLQHCERLKHDVTVSDSQAEALEKQTRQQSECEYWYVARAGRITASNMHAVVSTSRTKPALSTVKKVCYPEKHLRRPEPIKWGTENEERARDFYTSQSKLQHMKLKVEQCGFIINPSFPELGATPDALVSCECCGSGCVEIKCPIKHRDHTVLQACADRQFCLQLTDGTLELKRSHSYYKQVQTQIFVTKAKFCDFVVWTMKECAVIRVRPDVDAWEELLPAAKGFFYQIALPELVARHYTSSVPSVPRVEPSADLCPSRKRKKTC